MPFNIGVPECIFLSAIVALAFWLWALVDCLQRAPANGNDKIVWVLVVILLKPLGAILYAVIQRPKWMGPR